LRWSLVANEEHVVNKGAGWRALHVLREHGGLVTVVEEDLVAICDTFLRENLSKTNKYTIINFWQLVFIKNPSSTNNQKQLMV